MIKIVLAGGNQELIDHVVNPFLENHKDCEFVITTTESIEKSSNKIRITKHATTDEATVAAVEVLKTNPKAILMKGLVQTSAILKEVLRTENNLKEADVLSQVSKIELPDGREFLLTDSGLNIAPTVEQKIEITKNAIKIAQLIHWENPKTAILSSVEVHNPKMPSSIAAKEVAAYFESGSLVVEGPISMDVAMDQASAKIKGYQGKIQGDADILVVPNIDAGNILYKALVKFVGAKISGMLVGAKIPIVLTSRSDSHQSKINSIEFAVKTVVNKKNEEKGA